MSENLLRYFPDLSKEKLEKFDALKSVYAHWNAQINVISRKDFDQFDERHLLHSLALALYWKPESGGSVLDIGTGGGFPGIPLAIMFPETNFLLADSIGKKIKVVEEVARELDLQNVNAQHERVEKIKGNFQTAITRAVARLALLTRYCTQSKMKVEKLICLKGGDLREEINEVTQFPIATFNIESKIKEPFFETKKVVWVDFRV